MSESDMSGERAPGACFARACDPSKYVAGIALISVGSDAKASLARWTIDWNAAQ